MGTLSISPVVFEDILAVAADLRRDDEQEIFATAHMPAIGMISESVRMSDGGAWAVRVDGKILGVYGVARLSLLPDVAAPWAITTNEADRHHKSFLAASRLAMKDLRSKYGSMVNYVDARYSKALRWAERLGFTVEQRAVPFGIDRMPFYRISIGGA